MGVEGPCLGLVVCGIRDYKLRYLLNEMYL